MGKLVLDGVGVTDIARTNGWDVDGWRGAEEWRACAVRCGCCCGASVDPSNGWEFPMEGGIAADGAGDGTVGIYGG